jgi:hypothetical protein
LSKGRTRADREIEKNPVSAARHFAAALATARDAAYLEGRREAAEALRRVRTQFERAKKE